MHTRESTSAKTLIALAAAALVAMPARAQTTPPPASPPLTSTDATANTGTKATGTFAWAGLGLYGVTVSVDTGTAFGTVSASSTYLGIHGGAAVNLLPLAPGLSLAGFGDIALVFGGGGSFFPLTAGAAVRYDPLPVQLLGGLGFTLMPHTGDGTTPLGIDIMVMGLYPLPMVHPRLSGQAQIEYHILSSGFSLWDFTVGAGFGF